MKQHLSQFGTVISTPYLFPGNPNYAYIDCLKKPSPKKKQVVNGARISVKLKHHTQAGTDAYSLCTSHHATSPPQPPFYQKVVKVSIFGDKVPNVEEIHHHFSQFGTVISMP